MRLNKVVPPGCAGILVKLEWENPTGSMKDRMAAAVISRAEEDGRAFSPEKLDQMRALGAELTLVPSEGGKADQLNNQDSIAGYYPLGEEIWSQTMGKVDAFVHSVGTAASSRGVATVLKKKTSDVTIAVVEPGESAVLRGGQPGPHKIEGVGIGYTPPLWVPSLVDDILAVNSDDAKAMARRLASEEGLFAGTSSGANVVGAIEIAKRPGLGRTVVTLLCDSGLKYLNTDVYRNS